MLRMNPPGHENAIIDNYVPIYRLTVLLGSTNILMTFFVSDLVNTRLESPRIWIFPRSCNEASLCTLQLISLSAD